MSSGGGGGGGGNSSNTSNSRHGNRRTTTRSRSTSESAGGHHEPENYPALALQETVSPSQLAGGYLHVNRSLSPPSTDLNNDSFVIQNAPMSSAMATTQPFGDMTRRLAVESFLTGGELGVPHGITDSPPVRALNERDVQQPTQTQQDSPYQCRIRSYSPKETSVQPARQRMPSDHHDPASAFSSLGTAGIAGGRVAFLTNSHTSATAAALQSSESTLESRHSGGPGAWATTDHPLTARPSPVHEKRRSFSPSSPNMGHPVAPLASSRSTGESSSASFAHKHGHKCQPQQQQLPARTPTGNTPSSPTSISSFSAYPPHHHNTTCGSGVKLSAKGGSIGGSNQVHGLSQQLGLAQQQQLQLQQFAQTGAVGATGGGSSPSTARSEHAVSSDSSVRAPALFASDSSSWHMAAAPPSSPTLRHSNAASSSINSNNTNTNTGGGSIFPTRSGPPVLSAVERAKRVNASSALPEYAPLLPPESNKLGLQARNAVQQNQLTSAHLRSLTECAVAAAGSNMSLNQWGSSGYNNTNTAAAWTANPHGSSSATHNSGGATNMTGIQSSSTGSAALMPVFYNNYSSANNSNHHNNRAVRSASGGASATSSVKTIPSWLTQARTPQQFRCARANSLPGTGAVPSEKSPCNNSMTSNPHSNSNNNTTTTTNNNIAHAASSAAQVFSSAFPSAVHPAFLQYAASSISGSNTQPLQRRRHIRANRPTHNTSIHATGGNAACGMLTDSATSVAGCYTASGNSLALGGAGDGAGPALLKGVLIAAETVHEEHISSTARASNPTLDNNNNNPNHYSSMHYTNASSMWPQASQSVPRSPLYVSQASSGAHTVGASAWQMNNNTTTTAINSNNGGAVAAGGAGSSSHNTNNSRWAAGWFSPSSESFASTTQHALYNSNNGIYNNNNSNSNNNTPRGMMMTGVGDFRSAGSPGAKNLTATEEHLTSTQRMTMPVTKPPNNNGFGFADVDPYISNRSNANNSNVNNRNKLNEDRKTDKKYTADDNNRNNRSTSHTQKRRKDNSNDNSRRRETADADCSQINKPPSQANNIKEVIDQHNEDDERDERNFRMRNFNAIHAIPWDMRRQLPMSGFGTRFFALLSSPRFWEKLDWTVRGALLTVLPTMVLSLDPTTSPSFPMASTLAFNAFWITMPTFGSGLREFYATLKGFTLGLLVLALVVWLQPGPVYLSMILLAISTLATSFISEGSKKPCAYLLNACVMQYISTPQTTNFYYIKQFYVGVLIALSFGLAAFLIPFVRWSSDITRHYITAMGSSLSISVQGLCGSFWSRNPLERELNVTRLKQLATTADVCMRKAEKALSETGYEPHSGAYVAQLRVRLDFCKDFFAILRSMMTVIELIASEPERINTPTCTTFGRLIGDDLAVISSAMDGIVLKVCDFNRPITAQDVALFCMERRIFQEAVSRVREEVILNNKDYETDESEIFLGFFMFSVDELCEVIANFDTVGCSSSRIVYALMFWKRDLDSVVNACRALSHSVRHNHTIPRRLKEAIKLTLCMCIPSLFQVYVLHNDTNSVMAGASIIALVYNPTGSESFHYASGRLLGTVLGSMAALMSVQMADGRLYVLYIFVAIISFIGCYVQAAPDFYALGNAIVCSVISIATQYKTQSAAMQRIQQNCFAILMYFVIASMVWPMRAHTKVKMGLDVSLRCLRESTSRLLRNLDMPEAPLEVVADVSALLKEMSKKVNQQRRFIPGAIEEPTMSSAEFPEDAWKRVVAAEAKLHSTLCTMCVAYHTFMSGRADADTELSVHWVILRRIAGHARDLSDLIYAVMDLYLLSVGKVTQVPTAHLTRLRNSMMDTYEAIQSTYIQTIHLEVNGDESLSNNNITHETMTREKDETAGYKAGAGNSYSRFPGDEGRGGADSFDPGGFPGKNNNNSNQRDVVHDTNEEPYSSARKRDDERYDEHRGHRRRSRRRHSSDSDAETNSDDNRSVSSSSSHSLLHARSLSTASTHSSDDNHPARRTRRGHRCRRNHSRSRRGHHSKRAEDAVHTHDTQRNEGSRSRHDNHTATRAKSNAKHRNTRASALDTSESALPALNVSMKRGSTTGYMSYNITDEEKALLKNFINARLLNNSITLAGGNRSFTQRSFASLVGNTNSSGATNNINNNNNANMVSENEDTRIVAAAGTDADLAAALRKKHNVTIENNILTRAEENNRRPTVTAVGAEDMNHSICRANTNTNTTNNSFFNSAIFGAIFNKRKNKLDGDAEESVPQSKHGHRRHCSCRKKRRAAANGEDGVEQEESDACDSSHGDENSEHRHRRRSCRHRHRSQADDSEESEDEDCETGSEDGDENGKCHDDEADDADGRRKTSGKKHHQSSHSPAAPLTNRRATDDAHERKQKQLGPNTNPSGECVTGLRVKELDNMSLYSNPHAAALHEERDDCGQARQQHQDEDEGNQQQHHHHHQNSNLISMRGADGKGKDPVDDAAVEDGGRAGWPATARLPSVLLSLPTVTQLEDSTAEMNLHMSQTRRPTTISAAQHTHTDARDDSNPNDNKHATDDADSDKDKRNDDDEGAAAVVVAGDVPSDVPHDRHEQQLHTLANEEVAAGEAADSAGNRRSHSPHHLSSRDTDPHTNNSRPQTIPLYTSSEDGPNHRHHNSNDADTVHDNNRANSRKCSKKKKVKDSRAFSDDEDEDSDEDGKRRARKLTVAVVQGSQDEGEYSGSDDNGSSGRYKSVGHDARTGKMSGKRKKNSSLYDKNKNSEDSRTALDAESTVSSASNHFVNFARTDASDQELEMGSQVSEAMRNLSFFNEEKNEFVLTNNDIHSLEAFLFCTRALVVYINELQDALLDMQHKSEIAKQL